MRKTDKPLDPSVERRLRIALDRVQPRSSAPRYASESRLTPWRFAPIALAIGITGVMALTVSAATGTVNPAVLVNRISTSIEPPPESTPAPTPQESPKAVAPVYETPKPEPKETPEPTERPGPAPSSPAPTPEPGEDHSVGSSNPTPPPTDH